MPRLPSFTTYVAGYSLASDAIAVLAQRLSSPDILQRWERRPDIALNQTFWRDKSSQLILPFESDDGGELYLWVLGVFPSFNDKGVENFKHPGVTPEEAQILDGLKYNIKCVQWPKDVVYPEWFYPRLKKMILAIFQEKGKTD